MQEGSLCSRFLGIKQSTTVAELCHRFETYSAPLSDLTDDVLENTFLNELLSSTKAQIVRRESIGWKIS